MAGLARECTLHERVEKIGAGLVGYDMLYGCTGDLCAWLSLAGYGMPLGCDLDL